MTKKLLLCVVVALMGSLARSSTSFDCTCHTDQQTVLGVNHDWTCITNVVWDFDWVHAGQCDLDPSCTSRAAWPCRYRDVEITVSFNVPPGQSRTIRTTRHDSVPPTLLDSSTVQLAAFYTVLDPGTRDISCDNVMIYRVEDVNSEDEYGNSVGKQTFEELYLYCDACDP